MAISGQFCDPSSFCHGMLTSSKISREFFANSVHDVAPAILGATLLVDGAGGRIVELFQLYPIPTLHKLD